MVEIDAIRMRQLFPASPKQKNALFACDAELVELESGIYGLSMDEFSPEEDLLPSNDPEALGGNLAVAVIADVLAAGCLPEFYMHAVAVPSDDSGFCEALARGVRNVLVEGNCFFIGGDYGRTEAPNLWRYTGFTMGRAGKRGPLRRILPEGPQALWVTGTVGDGNIHAFGGTMPRFEPRFVEARVIRAMATTCIDTSGGLAESLLTLHMCNPHHRLDIDGASVPLDPAARDTAQALGFPEGALAFGGAGEYELLFAVPEHENVPGATRIGTASADSTRSGVYWNGVRLSGLPDARSFPDRREYVAKLLEATKPCLT